jgi:hypothetical protein
MNAEADVRPNHVGNSIERTKITANAEYKKFALFGFLGGYQSIEHPATRDTSPIGPLNSHIKTKGDQRQSKSGVLEFNSIPLE